ncbi:MAG: helix-turn-helix domain-containing protein [Alphaproteobacteria bacterium]|nr:helix-turn-helix domain-containing protein [Alphaproteobacteria bacterium]MCB9698551.1 helix-turn-helix domain-containing protein [Alphaproteobacteria bacterium]
MADPTLPEDLLKVLADTTDPAELATLLSDLLTPAEIVALAERWQIVRLLNQGMPQRAVAEELQCSVTTVSRGARQLRYGTGALARAFARIDGEG